MYSKILKFIDFEFLQEEAVRIYDKFIKGREREVDLHIMKN